MAQEFLSGVPKELEEVAEERMGSGVFSDKELDKLMRMT